MTLKIQAKGQKLSGEKMKKEIASVNNDFKLRQVQSYNFVRLAVQQYRDL